MCISHFQLFSVFLAIFHVKQCLCLIFPFIKFLVIVHVLRFAFQIFYIFQCFSRYFKSYSVCFSFSMIFSFFAIHQVLQYAILIFTFFNISRQISLPTVCVSHFPPFSVFLAIFQVLQCSFLIFLDFECFSPYSMSYSLFLSCPHFSLLSP